MAITPTALATASNSTDAASFTTASISPSANVLVLAWIFSSRAGPAAPTVTGNGLTWVQVATVGVDTIAAPGGRLTLFRAMGAAPTSGAVTIAFAGVVQSGIAWSIIEWSGVETSGTHGSGAIVQSKTAAADTGPTSWTTTLDSAPTAGNVTAEGHVLCSTGVLTPEWTELGNITYSGPTRRLQTMWSSAADQSAGVTTASSAAFGSIAVEIDAAAAALAPTVALFNRGMNVPLQAGVN